MGTTLPSWSCWRAWRSFWQQPAHSVGMAWRPMYRSAHGDRRPLSHPHKSHSQARGAAPPVHQLPVSAARAGPRREAAPSAITRTPARNSGICGVRGRKRTTGSRCSRMNPLRACDERRAVTANTRHPHPSLGTAAAGPTRGHGRPVLRLLQYGSRPGSRSCRTSSTGS